MIQTFAAVSVMILALCVLAVIIIFGKQMVASVSTALKTEEVSVPAAWGLMIGALILLVPIVINAFINLTV